MTGTGLHALFQRGHVQIFWRDLEACSYILRLAFLSHFRPRIHPNRNSAARAGKVLNIAFAGRIARGEQLPAKIVLLSSGRRYAAPLNNGYGMQQAQAHQSAPSLISARTS
jgi:hypothetical protein